MLPSKSWKQIFCRNKILATLLLLLLCLSHILTCYDNPDCVMNPSLSISGNTRVVWQVGVSDSKENSINNIFYWKRFKAILPVYSKFGAVVDNLYWAGLDHWRVMFKPENFWIRLPLCLECGIFLLLEKETICHFILYLLTHKANKRIWRKLNKKTFQFPCRCFER